MANLLEATNISFAYGKQVALTDVSLTLAAGEIVALIGPNGSGKSTLLKTLLGYLRASGQILWDHKPVARWEPRELARRVAYLPQSPRYEPGQTVVEVLRLGRAPYWAGFGLEKAGDDEEVRKVAAMLSLEEILHRSMDELSGGQQQRVFIGRCLAQNPAALLLDEPSTFLDLKHQVDLCHTLRELAKKGIGILIAWHDLNLAGAYADRVVLLNEGKFAASGAAGDVLTAEILSGVYGIGIQRLESEGGKPVIVAKD
jgi:iron complex transport system ATP-binding protein